MRIKNILKLIVLTPIMAFAWGNYNYATASSDTTTSYQANVVQTTNVTDERLFTQMKCANLLSEAKLYQDRWIEFRHHRDPDSGETKNWQRLNELQTLIEKYCEH